MWGRNGLKWKFSFQIISGLTRKEREREIAPKERSNPEPFDFAPFDFAGKPRAQSPSTSHPSTSLFDFNFKSHPSTSPTNPEPKSRLRLRRDRTETAPIAPITLRSQLRNCWVLMNLTGFYKFFLVGFCFCVYLLRNGIIYLFGNWENVRNKKKMCFLYYF